MGCAASVACENAKLHQFQSSTCRRWGHTNTHSNPLKYIGAFGGKLTRHLHVAAAAALGAVATNRPCRLALELKDDMRMTGGRFPTLMRYRLRCTPDGKISALLIDVYMGQSMIISDFAVCHRPLNH